MDIECHAESHHHSTMVGLCPSMGVLSMLLSLYDPDMHGHSSVASACSLLDCNVGSLTPLNPTLLHQSGFFMCPTGGEDKSTMSTLTNADMT